MEPLHCTRCLDITVHILYYLVYRQPGIQTAIYITLRRACYHPSTPTHPPCSLWLLLSRNSTQYKQLTVDDPRSVLTRIEAAGIVLHSGLIGGDITSYS